MANDAASTLAFVSTLGVVEILGPGPANHVCVRPKGGVGRHFVHVSMIDDVNSVMALRAQAELLEAVAARAAASALPAKPRARARAVASAVPVKVKANPRAVVGKAIAVGRRPG
jgi:hypothetical protein